MAQKVMTKFEISVTEYDPSGYYYPKYKSTHTVIAESTEEAKTEAIRRAPWQHRFGSGWTMKAAVVTSEDVIVET